MCLMWALAWVLWTHIFRNTNPATMLLSRRILKCISACSRMDGTKSRVSRSSLVAGKITLTRLVSLMASFFDTYGEYYADLKAFQDHLPEILRPGGIYSFFNGLCPRNIFFHGVCCQVVQLQLSHMGIEANFHACELQADANADDTWDGVKRRYWWNDTYYLPVCIRSSSVPAASEAAAGSSSSSSSA
mmetsp:Transcript_9146/g.16035  ORF Transcript_9146/g.16035 Transcript_9146/m.16035 type:complete len:188 (+) Transcript_9146:702-1265(+)